MRNPDDLNNDQQKPRNRKIKINDGNSINRNNNDNQDDFEGSQMGKRRHVDYDDDDNNTRNDNNEDENDFLKLSLSFGPSRPKRANLEPQFSLSPPQQEISQPRLQAETLTPQITSGPFQLPASHSIFAGSTISDPSPSLNTMEATAACPPRQPRARRNPTQAPREGKADTVPAVYPWATNHRATVYSLDYLLSKKIETITGAVQCKRCEKQYELEFNLRQKFLEVGTFIAENKVSMHDRAPSVWMNPVLPTCRYCDQENSAKPVISDKKKTINWLFLLLGQMLGCCTLEQLKYFCKHTKNHRTGAKDRVLYLTYLGLCKQLDPDGPFGR